jgi:hypothetical protein
MARMFRIIIAALLIGFAPGLSVAQGTTSRLLVDVLDKTSGAQIDGLVAANFRVKIDGRMTNIDSAQRTVLRPRVAVLLDSSGSMTAPVKWNAAIDLAEAIVQRLSAVAEVALVPFSDQTREMKTIFGGEESIRMLEAARPAPNSAPFPRGRTALWDAVLFAIQSDRLRPDDAVVIISDGGDNHSKHDFPTMRKSVWEAGVRIFGVSLPDFQPLEEAESINFRQLTEDTGGGVVQFGRETQGPYGPYYQVSEKEKQAVADFGDYIARRVVHPYVLSLEALPGTAGKLKVELLDASGKRDRHYAVAAQHRIAEQKSN